MRKIELIRARVTKAAMKENETGPGTMRIPGMKIGTQMNPGGPNFEDIVFLCDLLDKCGEFMKHAEFVNESDALMAKKLIYDINQRG